jgi:hypothetical protein
MSALEGASACAKYVLIGNTQFLRLYIYRIKFKRLCIKYAGVMALPVNHLLQMKAAYVHYDQSKLTARY